MAYDVKLTNVPATPLLAVRRSAPQSQLSKVVPESCGVVWDFIRKNDITPRGRNVAVYLNGKIDMEVGVEVSASAAGSGDVVLLATPSGTAVTATHWGDYRALHAAHDAIRQWCSANHYSAVGASWEIYGHMGDDPAKVRTDVFYLVAPCGRPAA